MLNIILGVLIMQEQYKGLVQLDENHHFDKKRSAYIEAFENYINPPWSLLLRNDDQKHQAFCQRAEEMKTAIGRANDWHAIETFFHDELDQLETDGDKKSKYYDVVVEQNNINNEAIKFDKSQDDRQAGLKLRQAQENIGEDPDSLIGIKHEICQILEVYTKHINLGCIAIPKCSFFGHHHNDRARAVKQAILGANDADEIGKILMNQKGILEDKGYHPNTLPSDLNDRWTKAIMNSPPKNSIESGYCRQINAALNAFDAKYELNDSPSNDDTIQLGV